LTAFEIIEASEDWRQIGRPLAEQQNDQHKANHSQDDENDQQGFNH
jgi:hypothetical protein